MDQRVIIDILGFLRKEKCQGDFSVEINAVLSFVNIIPLVLGTSSIFLYTVYTRISRCPSGEVMLKTDARRALLIFLKEKNVYRRVIVRRVTCALKIFSRVERNEVSATTTRQCRRNMHSSTVTSKKAKCQKLSNAIM